MLTALSLSLAAFCLPAQTGERPGYDFEILSTAPQGTSLATALSGTGITGGWCRAGGPLQACLWIDGARQLLGGTVVMAVNREGVAVISDSTNSVIAYRYDHQAGTYTLLPALLGGRATPRDVNSFGFAVGISSDAPGAPPRKAVLWDRDAVPHDLGTLGGTRSDAAAINDLGWIVGNSTLPGDLVRRPVAWIEGSMRELPIPPGQDEGFALDVNERGTVVGAIRTDNVNQTAIWTDAQGEPRLLDPKFGSAVAINNRGQIVCSGGAQLWLLVGDQLLPIKDIAEEPQSWKYQAVHDIDDEGRITGWGVNGNGFARGFLLTPKAANVNLDATLDRADLAAFARAYGRGDDLADMNRDGELDWADLRAFARAFRAGR